MIVHTYPLGREPAHEHPHLARTRHQYHTRASGTTGKKLVCVTKEGLKVDETEEERKALEELKSQFQPLW